MEIDLEREMLRRVHRHLLTSFGGIVLAVTGLAAYARRAAFGVTGQHVWLAIVPVAMIAAIPAIGFASTFRNLRCPACEKLVALQVSSNASLLGAMAKKTCNRCGKKIFGDAIVRSFRRMVVVVFASSLLFFLALSLIHTRR